MAINNSKTTKGPVKIAPENNTAKFSSKNPKSVDNVNQKRGPTVGNSGTASKRSAFNAAKEAWGATATMIANAIGERSQKPDIPKTNHQKNQGQISPNTNKGRGPTRGNK